MYYIKEIMHNQKETKLSSDSWSKLLNILVLDPDGWDRSPENFEKDWTKKILYQAFLNKMFYSTTQRMDNRQHFIDYDNKICQYIFRYGKNLKRKDYKITGIIGTYDFTYDLISHTIIISGKYFRNVEINGYDELIGALKIQWKVS